MVGTHLVDGGNVLKAQARLGHRDPATTLRHYLHAVQLDDMDVADELDDLLNRHMHPDALHPASATCSACADQTDRAAVGGWHPEDPSARRAMPKPPASAHAREARSSLPRSSP
jgi:hypothetical protein